MLQEMHVILTSTLLFRAQKEKLATRNDAKTKRNPMVRTEKILMAPVALITPLSFIAGARARVEDVFHPPTEISEFYGMVELTKKPLLFTPTADPGELTSKVGSLLSCPD
jgi:hypothetical protein